MLLSHARGTTAPLQVISFIPLYQHIKRFVAGKNSRENNAGYSELRGSKERIRKSRYIYTYSSVKRTQSPFSGEAGKKKDAKTRLRAQYSPTKCSVINSSIATSLR